MKLKPRIIDNDFTWTTCKPNWIERNFVRCRVTVESVKTWVCFTAWMGSPWGDHTHIYRIHSWAGTISKSLISSQAAPNTHSHGNSLSPHSVAQGFCVQCTYERIPLTGVIFTVTERGQWTRTGSHLSCVSAVDEMLDLGKKKEIFLWKVICK